MERVYKSVTAGRRSWSIIIKNNKYHFRGELCRCDCLWTGCKKVKFRYMEVAELYSRYQFMKFDRQHTVYYSEDCSCYHLRTNRGEGIRWVR